jgi:hypothetical protein
MCGKIVFSKPVLQIYNDTAPLLLSDRVKARQNFSIEFMIVLLEIIGVIGIIDSISVVDNCRCGAHASER